MSDLIKTLHKKGDNTVNVYPNIKSENIPDDAITTSKITNNAITTSKISDLSISTNKLQNGAVTTAKILAGAVTYSKIAYDAVTTDNIADGAVTESKIKNSSISNIKIYPGTITSSKLAFSIYHYIAIIEKANGFYIPIEFDSCEDMDINIATVSDWLSLIFNVKEDYEYYYPGMDLTVTPAVPKLFTFKLYSSSELDINGNDETSNIDIVDKAKINLLP